MRAFIPGVFLASVALLAICCAVLIPQPTSAAAAPDHGPDHAAAESTAPPAANGDEGAKSEPEPTSVPEAEPKPTPKADDKEDADAEKGPAAAAETEPEPEAEADKAHADDDNDDDGKDKNGAANVRTKHGAAGQGSLGDHDHQVRTDALGHSLDEFFVVIMSIIVFCTKPFYLLLNAV